MPRFRQISRYLTRPWLGPTLRDVIVCRALVGMAMVLGLAHLCGWSLWPCFFAKVTGLPSLGWVGARPVSPLSQGDWRRGMPYFLFVPGFVLLGILAPGGAFAPAQWRKKTAVFVERMERVTSFATIFLIVVLIYG